VVTLAILVTLANQYKVIAVILAIAVIAVIQVIQVLAVIVACQDFLVNQA